MVMEQIFVNIPLVLAVSVYFVCLHCCFTVGFGLNEEGLLLQQVKRSLSDPAGSLSSWSERDVTPCNWTGITCLHSYGLPYPSVVKVNLSSASLSGPFPMLLCRLPHLSELSLYNNFINSSLPLSISLCQSLESLELAQNLLSGSLPHTLADLPNLRHLDLDGNNFSGDIPTSFGRFRRLENLILTSNILNGTIPASLGNITTLRMLQLAYNPFSPSRIPPELGNLTNLVNFWLASCNLFGSIPQSFVKLTQLVDLDVSINQLTGPIPSFMSQLNRIVQIELFQNLFTGNLPTGWANLTQLRRIDVSTNHLTGPIPDELCELPLESLHLFENQLQGTLPESIAKSPNLFELRIFDNRLSGTLPSQLGLNSPLETLDVSENQFSGQIPGNLCRNGHLSALVIINNSFTGSIPSSLGKCQCLSRVRFRGNGLTGDVPAELWGLPHLYLLDLDDNGLSGNISHMIQGARNLSTLRISRNRFQGHLPQEIGMLESLIEFSAMQNKFSGSIPSSLFQLELLITLDLHSNELSGEIPRGSWNVKQLNELNLADNELSGTIPEEIGFLRGLNYLDLSSNNISGEIPSVLQDLKLNVLNLSHNRLSGPIPILLQQNVYRDSFVDNEGLCGSFAGLCHSESGSKNKGLLWVLRPIFVIVSISLIIGLVFVTWKQKNLEESKTGVIMTKWTSFHKLEFNEYEIMNCIEEDNVIGSGSSGKVYKAMLSNGQVVAVKKLLERSNKDETSFSSVGYANDEFEREVKTLGEIRHKNVVRLCCCCSAGNGKFLVYEYMSNGSLSDMLHNCKGALLDWPTRFKIALDAADGLSYLHHDCVPPIVHRDVKSSNILLDKDFGAKISDFGVAKIVKTGNKDAQCMSTVAGSCGYIAPEYAYTLRVNEKSDVYSFGIVLLELVTGRQPVDPEIREKSFPTWICTKLNQKGAEEVIDPSIHSRYKEHICKVLNISLHCTSQVPANRPSMRRVVTMLQESGPEFKRKTTMLQESGPEFKRKTTMLQESGPEFKRKTAQMEGNLPPGFSKDHSSQNSIV